MAVEDGHRDEIHVCNDVVEGEGDEGGGGPPDGDDFGNDLAGGDGNEDCWVVSGVLGDCERSG